jgi:sugar phosphate isomerase/epimerase
MQKFSIYTCALRNTPMEEQIALIKETGFDSICVEYMKNEDGVYTCEDQVKLAEKYDLPIENVHLSGSRMSSVWSDCEEGEFVTERLITQLKEMASYGIKTGIAHVTWGHEIPPAPTPLALHRYERAVEVAEQLGVKLALENSVFGAPLHFLLENIQSPNLGFCYDSGHEYSFAPEEDFLSKYGDRLIAMHLHDTQPGHDMHDLPFTQGIDWDKTIAALKKTEYFKEMITLEVVIQNHGNVEGLQVAYETLKKMAAM